MDKFLFLDIDGCMTSISDGNHYSCQKPGRYRVGRRTVELVKRICRDTGCKVVISSNWRKYRAEDYMSYSGMKFMNPLPELERRLGNLIYGKLPACQFANKSESLELWLEDEGRTAEDTGIAIIDDCSDEGFSSNPVFSRNFFPCDMYDGLTEDIALNIIRHLNGGKPENG